MNQPVELPQLSLQRYVDLVRRRRWQLVPVSLLGLLVGALVAFLIPRYYVAEVTFDYHRVEERAERGDDDPFGKIVRSAVATIPFAVGKAMERLKWPEALDPDPSARTLFEKDVRSRIQPWDANAGEKGRDFALIAVRFRDTDAERSYTLVNALFETWQEETVARLLKQHQEQLQRANEEFRVWDEKSNRYLDEKRRIEERHGIRPELPEAVQREDLRERRATELRLRSDLGVKEGARDALRGALLRDREELARLPERIRPTLADLRALLGDARSPELTAALRELEVLREGTISWREGTAPWRVQQANLRRAEEKLLKLVGADADAEGFVANPRYVALAKKVEADGRTLEGLQREVEALQRQLDAMQQRSTLPPTAFQEWQEKQKDLGYAEGRRKEAYARVTEHEGKIAALQANNPINLVQRASKPPHPTDPNILVVALIGAVLGLGVAIGLILLLDLLQASFKTADEVERGLGVPVLGGMSHLETEAERVGAVRSRRRAATAAFAFVALVVVTVTLYYRAPTRLPSLVRELLALLLGS